MPPTPSRPAAPARPAAARLLLARDRRTVGTVLLGALDPERRAAGVAALDRVEDPGALDAAAAFHGISGYVLRTYGDVPSLEPVRPGLRESADAATARHLRAVGDHRRAAALLADLGVPHLVVKGPVLAEHHHGAADLRSYWDLDLLVPARDLRRVVEELERQGWPLIDRNWQLIRDAVAGEVHLVAPLGTPLDLHWALLFRNTMRDHFPVAETELFERARTVRTPVGDLPTLDAVDTVLHLCLHAALSGGHRLLWIKDVERAVAVDRPDWDEVVRRARRRSLGVVTALMLGRSRRALGTPVPDDVLRALLPPSSARVVFAALDALVPTQRSSNRGSPARLVAKAARGTVRDTVREVGVALARLRPADVGTLRDPDSRQDPGALLLEPVGGAAVRSEYFSAVEAAASDSA